MKGTYRQAELPVATRLGAKGDMRHRGVPSVVVAPPPNAHPTSVLVQDSDPGAASVTGAP